MASTSKSSAMVGKKGDWEDGSLGLEESDSTTVIGKSREKTGKMIR